MDIKKVLLLGGSGFIGTYIANRLSQRGIEVTIPTRHRERTKALIMQPGVDMLEADIRCAKTLTELMRGHDAVINLVGILNSRDVKFPFSHDFAEAHVELPKTIIAACKAAGVRRLLHMSALKADPKAPSEYLASKGEGEAIVRAAQGELDVTIFRPSVVFGLGDSFLSLFAKVLKASPVFPLGFGHARLQPVWVADVADAFVDSLGAAASFARTYDLVGPKVYTLRELVEYTAKLCGSKARIVALPEGLAYLQAGLMWLAPKPKLSPDNLRSLQVDSVCEGGDCQLPAAWHPTALEAVAPAYIGRQTPKGKLDGFRYHAGR
ncbi:complex I NDUFA9 subunit family protein [Azonexus sp.]|jgi:NADH dehydrogenase|uniref:complex I NDUFA9 subunit family protein n=1 Tax=Azonexus sp. TaxID=1872668 RepID=UPI0028273527|nr:complex I NDUFA9 subunit family protein [Azonexus sp.]MDR1995511.1 complex I NDUFA9 subunit family protein [Azonexus sp.]